MKKISKVIVAAVVSAAVLFTFAAAEINVTLDGERLEFDVAPQIVNNRTMVPFRAIFEAFGAEVDWIDGFRIISAVTDDRFIQLGIDDPIAMVLNTETEDLDVIDLDTPPIIVNDRALVPIRFVSESLGARVDWDSDTQTVIIDTTMPPELSPYGAPHGPPWRIELAEDWLLSGYNPPVEFIEAGQEGYQKIAIIPYMAMREFRWFKVGLYEEEEFFTFYEHDILYSVWNLPARTPFVVNWPEEGTVPHRGVSFLDAHGVRRYYTLNMNHADYPESARGMFFLTEF